MPEHSKSSPKETHDDPRRSLGEPSPGGAQEAPTRAEEESRWNPGTKAGGDEGKPESSSPGAAHKDPGKSPERANAESAGGVQDEPAQLRPRSSQEEPRVGRSAVGPQGAQEAPIRSAKVTQEEPRSGLAVA